MTLMVFFQSCLGVLTPNINNMISSKKGDTKYNVSLGGIYDTKEYIVNGEVTEDQKKMPAIYASYQIKTQKDISYEFFLAGIRRIDELYTGGSFYFNIYESIYLPLAAVGGNIGILTGFKTKNFNFYLSSKFDAYRIIDFFGEGSEPLLNYYYNNTTSLGLSFNNKNTSFFLEATLSKNIYESNKSQVANKIDDLYLVYLGVSF